MLFCSDSRFLGGALSVCENWTCETEFLLLPHDNKITLISVDMIVDIPDATGGSIGSIGSIRRSGIINHNVDGFVGSGSGSFIHDDRKDPSFVEERFWPHKEGMINRLVMQCRWPVVGTSNIVAYTPGQSALVSWIVLALVRVLWRGRKGGLTVIPSCVIPRRCVVTICGVRVCISFLVQRITGSSCILNRVSDFIGLLCASQFRFEIVIR
jgi:hypothetical protein